MKQHEWCEENDGAHIHMERDREHRARCCEHHREPKPDEGGPLDATGGGLRDLGLLFGDPQD